MAPHTPTTSSPTKSQPEDFERPPANLVILPREQRTPRTGAWLEDEKWELRRLVLRVLRQPTTSQKNRSGELPCSIPWTEISKLHVFRTAKQCRERWDNHERIHVMNITLGPITPEEGESIMEMVRAKGTKWAEIGRLKGRPENSIKNWYYQEVKKKSGRESRRIEDMRTRHAERSGRIRLPRARGSSSSPRSPRPAAATPATAAHHQQQPLPSLPLLAPERFSHHRDGHGCRSTTDALVARAMAARHHQQPLPSLLSLTPEHLHRDGYGGFSLSDALAPAATAARHQRQRLPSLPPPAPERCSHCDGPCFHSNSGLLAPLMHSRRQSTVSTPSLDSDHSTFVESPLSAADHPSAHLRHPTPYHGNFSPDADPWTMNRSASTASQPCHLSAAHAPENKSWPISTRADAGHERSNTGLSSFMRRPSHARLSHERRSEGFLSRPSLSQMLRSESSSALAGPAQHSQHPPRTHDTRASEQNIIGVGSAFGEDPVRRLPRQIQLAPAPDAHPTHPRPRALEPTASTSADKDLKKLRDHKLSLKHIMNK